MYQSADSQSFDSSNYYYVVGNRRTYNKSLAIAWANGNHDLISLYWMDEVWENIDLTQRPTRSFQELMKERCLQLRNKANILSLNLSGGYDSYTILHTFAANNILLDEINVWARSFTNYAPGEPEWQSAFVIANLFKNTIYPNLKINKIDIDIDYCGKTFQTLGENWILDANWSCIDFVSQARLQQLNFFDSKILTKYQNIVKYITIDGFDKPKLWIENGNWYLTNASGSLDNNMNSSDEDFYISRDLIELHVAQAWMMIDWLESFPFQTEKELHTCLHATQSFNLGDAHNASWNIAIGRCPRDGAHYSLERSRKKSTNGQYSVQHKYIENKYPYILDSSDWKTWKNVLNAFIKTYPDMFMFDGSGKQVFAKKHFMKPVEPGRLNKKVILEQSL